MAKAANVRAGWISYMREALRMTQSALAKITGLSQATVQQIKKRKASGKV
jgi:transcriptional regulator with XRE-family HTH domain